VSISGVFNRRSEQGTQDRGRQKNSVKLSGLRKNDKSGQEGARKTLSLKWVHHLKGRVQGLRESPAKKHVHEIAEEDPKSGCMGSTKRR
jgi:hypothetical protein